MQPELRQEGEGEGGNSAIKSNKADLVLLISTFKSALYKNEEHCFVIKYKSNREGMKGEARR